MKPVRYVLKAGDTLWSVAEAHYGDPVRWPDLYAYNNRPDIVALTERPITDPGRLSPGQAIFLPPAEARATQRRAPASAATKGGAPASGLGGGGLTGGIRGAHAGATLTTGGLAPNPAAETFVNDFAHAFDLDGVRLALQGASGTATLALSGLVLLQKTGRVPLLRYSNRSAEGQARSLSAMLLGRLLAAPQTRLGWNPGRARLRLQTPLALNAGAPPPEGALARGTTGRGAPAWTARLALPDLAGRIAGHAYLTHGVVAQVALAGEQGAATDGQDGWLWLDGVPDPSVAILGATLSETAVTAGNGLADAATTLAAQGGHEIDPIAATASSWTPVQIGG
ncbi:hypothetical protein NS228_13535 [Methylobacterium indicum]|uniref:LysM peptidoglycan-binding domain-containing protein n=1 Tax=Methylobacterium indicum TaxID=1775910 RepID=UPI0007344A3E|nr:LysM domain-containing protein [Methylobacterium indicum]KTS34166.1 hypothetical protein NS229_11610 [Methylobacterium indicum]KTS39891.1 hypothetical protein NS228_13535 [Methylobacterium indicum]KTS54348.1 hypothetical protein NS230_01925 [Methylobacterium indicum]